MVTAFDLRVTKERGRGRGNLGARESGVIDH